MATSRRAFMGSTLAMAGGPIGEGFVDFTVAAARAGVSIPGLIRKGQPFTYAREGVAITAYELPVAAWARRRAEGACGLT